MMPNIFTSFDTVLIQPSLSYMYGLLPALMFLQLYWIMPPSRTMMTTAITKMNLILAKPTSGYSFKGMLPMLTSVFYTLIILNMTGAMPFLVTLSSHLLITLSMALPLWLTLIATAILSKTKKSSALFLPENAPNSIAPFLAMVEVLSSIIRPITLSFRLAANISAGHVILGMMSTTVAFILLSTMTMSSAFLPIMTGGGYSMFEFMICIIQAFVFTLLINMYSSDHIFPAPL